MTRLAFELLGNKGRWSARLRLEELRALLRAWPGTTYLLRSQRAGKARLTLLRLV